ncbi:hypothetical protein [Streptomyces sp. NPDC090445]|uniref:hypothetical protein n=1 Tax=Streptomyces sp. NPDC090445 TaxID=3365963 RepID=UPI0037FE2A47
MDGARGRPARDRPRVVAGVPAGAAHGEGRDVRSARWWLSHSEYAELESGRMAVFERTAEVVELVSAFLDRD